MNEDYRGVVPYLFYDDVGAAMAWYTRVFGFEEIGRWQNEAGLTCEAPIDRKFSVRMLNVDDGMGHRYTDVGLNGNLHTSD